MLSCFRWSSIYFLPMALVTIAAFAGCAKKDPVSAASSGLAPAGADDEEDAGEVDEPEENGENNPTGNGATKPPKVDGDEPADDGAGDPVDGKKPPTTPPADELYTVPQGEPAVLVKYLDRLDKKLDQLGKQAGGGQRLSIEAQEVIFKDVKRAMDARKTAAERILASDKADAKDRLRAVETKIQSLDFQKQLRAEDATEELDAFIASLKDETDPSIRRIVVENSLAAEITRVARGDQEDPAPLVAQVKELLAGDVKDLTAGHLDTAQNAAVALLRSQHVDAGVEVLKLIGTTFAASEDPAFIEAAQSMTQQGQAIALQHAAQQLEAGEETALARLLAEARSVTDSDDVQVQPLMMITQVAGDLQAEHPEAAKELSTLAAAGLESLIAKEDQELSVLAMAARLAKMMEPPNPDAVAKANELILARVQADLSGDEVSAESITQLLSEVAMQAEFGGDIELASQLYDSIAAATTKIDDAKAVESINRQLDAAKKRVGLIGKPLVVEGKLADGTPFDWKQYEGKTVLVDFWATWCGPCIREFPNIKENYENYHEQGFEVVGVNLDDDTQGVESFFAARGDLPWTTVFSPDDDARGFETPLAKASGVTAIPFVVLVGSDGTVAAIHVRGEQLALQLEKIFGPPTPKDDVPETGIVPEETGEETPTEEQGEDAVPETESAPE